MVASVCRMPAAYTSYWEERDVRFNKNYQHRMGLETLEDKRLLAGDVSVNVIEGSLVIRGDAENNGVAVTSGDSPGEFVVAGLPVGDIDTSINGVFDRVVVSGIFRADRMGLGEGLNVLRANVGGDVSVATGEGNDHVNIGGPRSDMGHANTLIRGRLSVDLGEDATACVSAAPAFGGGVDANAGPGNDDVAVVGSELRGTSNIRTARRGRRHGRTNNSHLHENWDGAGADRVALVDSAFSSVGVDAGVGEGACYSAGCGHVQRGFKAAVAQTRLHFKGRLIFGLCADGFETIQGGIGGITVDTTFAGLADSLDDAATSISSHWHTASSTLAGSGLSIIEALAFSTRDVARLRLAVFPE